MRIILLMLAFMLLIAGAEARYSPGLEIAEGENITLNGGEILGDYLPAGGVVVVSVDGVVSAVDHTGHLIRSGVAGTDDTDVLQAGLNALNDTYFSFDTFGIFYTDIPLRIPGRIHWSGHNSEIFADTSNSTVRDSFIRDDDATELKEYNKTIVIRDLILDGIDKSGDGYVEYGINISRARHAVLENINVLHCDSDGFFVRDDSWMTMLTNCKTYDNGNYAVHFVAGPNDKPNGCSIIGGRFMADDGGGIYIEDGTDIRVAKSSIESTGTAAYILDNASIFDGNYIEACTNGFYWGAGGDTIYGLTLTNNHMYSVTNPTTSVSASAGTVYMVGNTVDGVSIDTFVGWSTGTGSVQSIDFPAALKGVPFDVRVWNIETGYTNNPKFFTDETWTCLNITADNGINYRYKVQTGF